MSLPGSPAPLRRFSVHPSQSRVDLQVYFRVWFRVDFLVHQLFTRVLLSVNHP